MRIELPLPALADAAHRADDDAHTLTVAPVVATEWAGWQLAAEPSAVLRVQVTAPAQPPLTLTL